MSGVVLLGPGLRERYGQELEELGYFVTAIEHVASIDDVAAAVLEVKQATPGGIGAIGIGAAATLLLEAATVLPQLDGIALFGVKLPAARPHYARMRVQVLVHRATRGNGLTAEELAHLNDEARAGQIVVQDAQYNTANDRFFVEPADDAEALLATLAWDLTRDFLVTALPVVEGA